MDVLDVLRTKATRLSDSSVREGLRAVIRHIEAAERHLIRAESEDDQEAYNDVLYRTNQAYEGMLKEAYCVLLEKNASKMTPSAIEQQFQSDGVLKDRVLELFTNYRQRWRNPATHDHRLFFDQHEAFLAVTTITAFANILLDRIHEALSSRHAKEVALPRRKEIHEAMKPFGSSSLLDRVTALLRQFSRMLSIPPLSDRSMRETEIIGLLGGFIATVSPSLTALREVAISTGRPDFLVQEKEDSLIIEVKRWTGRAHLLAAVDQVGSYLGGAKITQGVLYYPPVGKEKESEEAVYDFEQLHREEDRSLRVVGPRSVVRNLEQNEGTNA